MRHLPKLLIFVFLFLITIISLQRFANPELLRLFLAVACIGPLMYLAVDRFAQKNHLLTMKEEALRAELTLLKNQVNPHFFFNTLNNLYGLTVEGSPKAPDMILKLSDLMRFTIYEGRRAVVPLEDEVAYLENYLAIMSLRARASKVSVTFDKQISDEGIEAPPLMFIMLVENAFKHGVATKTEDAFIRINLAGSKRRIVFDIENNFDEPDSKPPSGIGQENLRRRLQLLYPGRHELEMTTADGVYRASLRIEL